jgi:release factor glutamine methyltransferase
MVNGSKLTFYFYPMTLQEAEQQLSLRLRSIYDDREAPAIAGLIMENLSGQGKLERIISKSSILSIPATGLLEKYTKELLAHKPPQYVLQEAWFYGLKFYVNENVLIPRPETEELLKWIVDESGLGGRVDGGRKGGRVLDMGTGSGCIAIALKKILPEMEIIACDISRDALEIARRNAITNLSPIDFLELDFLDETQRDKLPYFDCIACNLPYVPLQDKRNMRPNVLDYEPHLALFVPDGDPLVFYRALADFGVKRLFPGGEIFAELHEGSAADIKKLFSLEDFSAVVIKTDMQGKDRMIKATRLL